MKSGLTKLGKILNILGIFTFRVEKEEIFGNKIKITYNEGFNFKNPLTWIITPFIYFAAILEGGINNTKDIFKRDTYTKTINK